MAQFFGIVKLRSPDDWKGLAGDGNWVPTRSAYELAYAWHGVGGFPTTVLRTLVASGEPALAGLRLEVGLVEKPVFLDTLVGPSMTDIMVYARNAANEAIVVAVEGKATEAFGLPVHAWVRGDSPVPPADAKPKPSRARRLRYLCERLGIPYDPDSSLHYQLLHRTVSGLSEGTLQGAAAVVLLVHSFAHADELNFEAYSAFVQALGGDRPSKNVVTGPLHVPSGHGIPLFSLWVADSPRQGAA